MTARIRSRYPHAKLPGKAQLELEYLRGASTSQLAAKYGCNTKTVYNTMRRRAISAGTPWPLKQGQHGWQKRRAAKYAEMRWDSVTTLMIRAEIRDCQDKYGLPTWQLVILSGLSQTTVWEVSNGTRNKVARETATAIMEVITACEEGRVVVGPQRRGPTKPIVWTLTLEGSGPPTA